MGRFMENLLGLATVPWDHEPLATPRWTESADKSDALQTLRAFRRVSGPRVSVWSACVFSAAFDPRVDLEFVRFMESLDGILAVPWDHEPRGKSKAPQQRAHSKTWRIFGPRNQRASCLGLRRCSAACDRRETLQFVRFMEMPHDSCIVH